jgi:putative transposase
MVVLISRESAILLEELYMKKSRFSDSQIMAILKKAESGIPVTEICCEEGISSALFYRWRSKYGGMDVSLMSRLKELEAENACLMLSGTPTDPGRQWN